jgi:3-oxoadipate enol-lactonase
MTPAAQRTPLLLVHGFPLDHTQWQPQAALSDVARVITPDLPGFGASTAPHDTMTMDDYAEHLKGVLDEMRLERAVVCGLSMGGYVALAFLAKYPDAVQGLILCNTRAGADDEKGREGRRASEATVKESGVAAIAKAMLPKMLTPATLAAMPGLGASVHATMARQPAAGVIAALRGMAARPDRTPMLSSIRVPTLIITGSADTLIPPGESEAMAKAIPDSRLVVIPSVAHLSNLESPDAFDAAVRDFLAVVTSA